MAVPHTNQKKQHLTRPPVSVMAPNLCCSFYLALILTWFLMGKPVILMSVLTFDFSFPLYSGLDGGGQLHPDDRELKSYFSQK